MNGATRLLLNLNRTVHVYLTMAGAGLLVFVAVSGFLASHKSWFVSEESAEHPAFELPATWASAQPPDFFRIGEALRARFGDIGIAMEPLPDPRPDDVDFELVYAKPGSVLTATIVRATGSATVTIRSRATAGALFDLHTVRNSGPLWRWCMDAAAVVLALAAITGVILCVTSPTRRWWGLTALIAGAMACAGVYVCLA
jgi:hypothetical protein